ncbi:hypothetical protein [Kaarinaea lacus]
MKISSSQRFLSRKQNQEIGNCSVMSGDKKRVVGLILVCCFYVYAPHIAAQEQILDKFRIAIGGYSVPRSESEISLSEPEFGAGVSLSPEKTLGLNTEQTVVRLDGHYRFNQKHALTYSWFRITSDGTKSIEEDINWIDENGNPITIPVGASVNTVLEYDVYKVGYLWSFYHNDVVELAAGVGLHITKIAVGLTAETTTTGIDASDVSVTVPLPVLSFGLIYKVTPKFGWFVKSEIFAIEFNNWEGSYTDGSAGVEYRMWKQIGLGLGIGTNSLKIVETTDDYRFSFANRITGLSIYVAGYF